MSSATQLGAVPSGLQVSSFLLSNLHCPSCIPTIRKALLGAFTQHISWLSPNLVTSVVTVEHGAAATSKCMRLTLEKAGFNVAAVATSPSASAAGQQQAQDGGAAAGNEDDEDEFWHTFGLTPWTSCSSASVESAADQEQQAKIHLQNCYKC